ncbi:acyl-CoA/acyl-ACP dehydrogenase [Sphingobium sp. JS3065]|uniref:acyl-CoA dehydrogenase family protein n=1 Tax=Sphingobium sp. JS3065 TaxID=2970925 RepID=UPI0022651B92|nr:acyl-CoA dehydrogenase family protein [Sphingobium sp. JS3065]UZW57358.1 acyl-CoA/acyl-ACP dehydrogenase [Sphingobium sp. JS3065]
MNFNLSDDQRMLQDSIDRLIADRYQFEQRTGYASQPKGWSDGIWTEFVNLGLTMLPFPESAGGLGLGSVEMMLVGEAFGRALVMEPYLPSIVLAGTAIAEGAGDRAEALLAPIMSGEVIGAFADDATVALVDGRLSGRAALVLGGNCADLFVIPVGDGAYVVRADAPGLSRRGYRLHGGGGAADLLLDNLVVDAAAYLDVGCVTRARHAGIAFLAAEAAGAMQAALDVTVDYLKTREQFGKPIGTNQALQHRAAEMLVEVEQAKSAAIYAATLANETDEGERAKGFAAIKAVIGKAGRFIAQSAVQLHGGIGVSEEHVVSHWFRRLTAIGMILGNGQHHIDRLADLGGFTTVQEAA